jgi:ribulose-5-phosphate 4-epimerase/fuculose-1-phosphate aldolase
VRCDLAALYRLLAHFRMTDLIDTHISARVPGTASEFLINRYGVLFHEMRASDLLKIDDGGNLVDGRTASDGWASSVNKAGFVIHSAIHTARHDLMCVVHTHTAAGMAVAAQEQGLLPISQHALKFYDKLSYHDYEGIALDDAEKERLVADLGGNRAMILRNHGLLAAGRTIAEAFNLIYFLERACQAQVQAQAGGAALRTPSHAVCERTAGQFDGPRSLDYFAFQWAAACRLLGSDAAWQA